MSVLRMDAGIPNKRHMLTVALGGHSLRRMTGDPTPAKAIQVCRALLNFLVAAEGDLPTFHAIDLALRSQGLKRPDEAVLEARALGYLTFGGELTFPTRLALTVAGHYLAEPQDRLLHRYFIPVLRSLVDRLDRETLLSPTEARRVIVFANEMEQLQGATAVETKVLGRLLGVEPVGIVEWTDDPWCPWSIEIDFRIREFASIASIPDFLGVIRLMRM
jgi:hypothetical protein